MTRIAALRHRGAQLSAQLYKEPGPIVITKPIVDWLTRKRPPREFPLSDFERLGEELQPCDVILVEGRSRASEVIKLVTQSPWSHAALYLGRLRDIADANVRETIAQHSGADADEQLVVESQLGLGTIVRPLADYQHDHLRLCRPQGLTEHDAQQVIGYAASRVGTPYDVRQVFDLLRFLFPWFLLPRRWRSSLFRQKPGLQTKTVCSTMIAEAFAAVQFPILPLVRRGEGEQMQLFRRNPKLCTPSDFDYSPYFEIIKYPFLDLSKHASYRLLPWTRPEQRTQLPDGAANPPTPLAAEPDSD